MNLLNYSKDVYSQYGNDGIIEAILNTIGKHGGMFVEFGAGDGIKGSNCRKLWEESWCGLFIERRSDNFKRLFNEYSKDKRAKCLNLEVGFENLFDDIIDEHLGITPFFCSIDINGFDLDVFETFKKHLPDVVCIEGGQALSPYHERVDCFVSTDNIQQSLSVYVDVFEEKGYKLLGCHQDCFFVKEKYYHLFDVSADLLTLYMAGLSAQPHRPAYIYDQLLKHGLHNPIIDYIMERNYEQDV